MSEGDLTAVGATVDYLITTTVPTAWSGVENFSTEVGADEPKFIAPNTFRVIGVTGDQEPADIGPYFKREETFNVSCCIVVFAGDQDFKQRFDDSITYWKLIVKNIANDPTLGSNVRYAEPTSYQIAPAAGVDGSSLCTLEFDIACSVRVTSLS